MFTQSWMSEHPVHHLHIFDDFFEVLGTEHNGSYNTYVKKIEVKKLN